MASIKETEQILNMMDFNFEENFELNLHNLTEEGERTELGEGERRAVERRQRIEDQHKLIAEKQYMFDQYCKRKGGNEENTSRKRQSQQMPHKDQSAQCDDDDNAEVHFKACKHHKPVVTQFTPTVYDLTDETPTTKTLLLTPTRDELDAAPTEVAGEMPLDGFFDFPELSCSGSASYSFPPIDEEIPRETATSDEHIAQGITRIMEIVEPLITKRKREVEEQSGKKGTRTITSFIHNEWSHITENNSSRAKTALTQINEVQNISRANFNYLASQVAQIYSKLDFIEKKLTEVVVYMGQYRK